MEVWQQFRKLSILPHLLYLGKLGTRPSCWVDQSESKGVTMLVLDCECRLFSNFKWHQWRKFIFFISKPWYFNVIQYFSVHAGTVHVQSWMCMNFFFTILCTSNSTAIIDQNLFVFALFYGYICLNTPFLTLIFKR